jgi:hypothetical protein
MERSYLTPNTQIPHNNRAPGTIAAIAITQLQPYRIAAQTWPVYQESRDGRWVHACRVCEQAVWFNMDPNEQLYNYTEEEKLTLIIAHLRRCHEGEVNENA